ncbi:MAG: anthranilate synthase component I [Candidatus Thermochlorobacter sp.]
MQNTQRSAKTHICFQFQPLIEECLADTETPVSLFLKVGKPYSCLLESIEGEERMARFSYIGLKPIALFKAWLCGKEQLVIFDKKFAALAHLLEPQAKAPEKLERLLQAFSNAAPPQPSRMTTSGAFGYISYDAAAFVENLPVPQKDHALNLPDLFFCFYDTLIVFDNITRKVYLVTNYLAEDDRAEAEQKLYMLKSAIEEPLNRQKVKLSTEVPEAICANITREDYLKNVQRAKDYIFAGDVFQVQLSQRLERRLHAEPFDVYRALRTINPSPYLYYFDLDDVKIIGSSPELLVSVSNERGKHFVDTRPIAGTRPRGQTPEEDYALAQELLADEKERAEHLMLIDLSRNDVGRIAKIGSVQVTEQMVIERYSHVMHMVSHVRGELQDNLTALDAFWSCFPAGTLTGAPKIRAMEIIYELEQEKRGLYGGAVGYIDFSGELKMAIAIRTMLTHESEHGRRIYFQAAAGIVADSQPEREYQETLNKMYAGLRAVDLLIPQR